MFGWLSPDSLFMRCMSRIADLMLLNILFLLTSLPVVTIGASVTALYSVTFTIGTPKEAGIFKPYFRAFRDGFKMSTVVFLMFVFLTAALIADMVLFSRWGVIAFAIFGIQLVVEFLAASMAFPWISLFRNTLKDTLKNSLILGLGKMPQAVIVVLLWMFPVGLFFLLPELFFDSAFILLVIYFSGAAYLSGLLFRKTFGKYLPADTFVEEKA